mgnify:CR=1 FL=1
MIGETVSHYKILERIGGGSMGIVYEARDTRLNRNVALKFLPPAFTKDSEAKQRFIHEAQAASSLDHPNIYTIHEIDETNDGRLFICMTRYAGKGLNDILDEHELSLTESVDIAIQIARGLSKAHKNGIVHQDIKPANVLITEDGIAKIVDFGIARMTDQNISQTGSMVGTVAYMSPEQASGEMVDERSDIWSLGVVLYEMLTGEMPFQGQYEQAILYSIINQDPEPVRQKRPEVPEDLERIVERSLQKNPLERYQQIEDMLNDLMNLSQGSVTGNLSGKLVGEEIQTHLTILPFFNLSGKKEQDYFCEGFAEDLQNLLETVDNIHITSFKESMQLRKEHVDIRDISKHVSSDMILEGAIRRTDSSVRITTQLINVEDGTNIWADRYESQFEEILELRSEIIHNMIETLDITIDQSRISEILGDTTESVDAFDDYLKGLQSFRKTSQRSLQEAQEYFTSALNEDSDFLRVRELLTLTYFQQYLVFEAVQPGIQFDKILQLGNKYTSDSPVCDAVVQFISHFNVEEKKQAVLQLKQLSQENPENKFIQACFALSQFSEGLTEHALQIAKQTAESDTKDHFFILLSGIIAYYAGQYAYAESTLVHSIGLDPSIPTGHIWLGYTLLEQNNYDDASKEFELASSYSGESPFSQTAVAFYHARIGESNRARELAADLKQEGELAYVPSYYLSRIYAELGYTGESIDSLKKSIQQKEPGALFLRTDPVFKQMKDSAAFNDLFQETVSQPNT